MQNNDVNQTTEGLGLPATVPVNLTIFSPLRLSLFMYFNSQYSLLISCIDVDLVRQNKNIITDYERI